MKSIKSIFSLLLLLSVSHAAPASPNSFFQGPFGDAVMREAAKLSTAIRQSGGCHANVCFALDGSGSVNGNDYRMQKEFVELVAGIIGVDPTAQFAAVQFAGTLTAISPLTNNIAAFERAVQSSRHVGGGTFIDLGLGFCVSQLIGQKGDANKIVLLSDGRNSFGTFDPETTLKDFVPPVGTGLVCAVEIGSGNTRALERITGSPARVVTVPQYFKLISIVNDLVRDICAR